MDKKVIILIAVIIVVIVVSLVVMQFMSYCANMSQCNALMQMQCVSACIDENASQRECISNCETESQPWLAACKECEAELGFRQGVCGSSPSSESLEYCTNKKLE